MKTVQSAYPYYILKKFEQAVTKDYRLSEQLYRKYKGKNDAIFVEEELLQNFLGVSRCLKRLKDTCVEVETLHRELGGEAFEQHMQEEMQKLEQQFQSCSEQQHSHFGGQYENNS